jgi:hypothetical protein
MRRLLAVTTSAVVIGTAGLSAQGGSAPSPRPFADLFNASPPLAKPVVPLAPQRTPPALPRGPAKCHIVVLPADPRIDPRMSIAPPASRRFTIREATPACR